MSREETRALYEQFAPVVHRRAARLLRDPEEAWDVVQEVFAKLLDESVFVFRREAKLMTVVYRMTTNACLNRLRHGRVRAAAAVQLAGAELGHATSTMDAAVEARDFVLRIWEALDAEGQPERLKQVALYSHLDGMTKDEIATLLGVSRKTVHRDLEVVASIAARVAARDTETKP